LKWAIIAEGVDFIFSFHEVKAGKAKGSYAGLIDADAHGIGVDGFAKRFVPDAIVDDVLGFEPSMRVVQTDQLS
jgi:hypothetical protein